MSLMWMPAAALPQPPPSAGGVFTPLSARLRSKAPGGMRLIGHVAPEWVTELVRATSADSPWTDGLAQVADGAAAGLAGRFARMFQVNGCQTQQAAVAYLVGFEQRHAGAFAECHPNAPALRPAPSGPTADFVTSLVQGLPQRQKQPIRKAFERLAGQDMTLWDDPRVWYAVGALLDFEQGGLSSVDVPGTRSLLVLIEGRLGYADRVGSTLARGKTPDARVKALSRNLRAAMGRRAAALGVDGSTLVDLLRAAELVVRDREKGGRIDLLSQDEAALQAVLDQHGQIADGGGAAPGDSVCILLAEMAVALARDEQLRLDGRSSRPVPRKVVVDYSSALVDLQGLALSVAAIQPSSDIAAVVSTLARIV